MWNGAPRHRYNPDEKTEKYFCDFCNDRNITHIYPCQDFSISPPSTMGSPEMFPKYIGSWVACKKCARIVETGRVDFLLNRALRHLPPMPEDELRTISDYLTQVYQTFFRLKGPGRPITFSDLFEIYFDLSKDTCMSHYCHQKAGIEMRVWPFSAESPWGWARVCWPHARQKLGLEMGETTHPELRPLTPIREYWAKLNQGGIKRRNPGGQRRNPDEGQRELEREYGLTGSIETLNKINMIRSRTGQPFLLSRQQALEMTWREIDSDIFQFINQVWHTYDIPVALYRHLVREDGLDPDAEYEEGSGEYQVRRFIDEDIQENIINKWRELTIKRSRAFDNYINYALGKEMQFKNNPKIDDPDFDFEALRSWKKSPKLFAHIINKLRATGHHRLLVSGSMLPRKPLDTDADGGII